MRAVEGEKGLDLAPKGVLGNTEITINHCLVTLACHKQLCCAQPKQTAVPFQAFDEYKMILNTSHIKNIIHDQDCRNYIQNGNNIHADDNSSQEDTESSDVVIWDIKSTGMARCKCCLEKNRLKSLWQEHLSGGIREVYGLMLTECFALPWSRPQNPTASRDQICESCIMKLRAAVSFKTEVLASEQLLNGQLETVNVDKLKQERDDVLNIQTEYLHYEDMGTNDDNEIDDTCDDNDNDVDNNNDDSEKYAAGDKEIVIKSEPHLLLTETLTSSHKKYYSRRRIAGSTPRKKRSENLMDTAKKRLNCASKRFKVPRNVNCNMFKGVFSDDLMTDEWKEDNRETKNNIKNGIVFVEINKIMSDDMEESKTIAKIKEEISKKTGNKVKEKALGDIKKKPSENRVAEMKKQANNIAIILESTNATPIRRHGGIGYGCCFCNEEFPDAADLKQHTIKEHDVKTKRNYAKGKRPSAYLVKLDITGLKCNMCGCNIDSLEQLYDHLSEVHKKLLYRNAKNYIVPFKFDREELRCLFCEFICNSFKGLLEHMSVHYRNHICEICDAGFLTKNNLFNHAGRHKKGTFKCDYCPKVFDTSSKKAGHQRLVHSSTNGVNRCGYCGEMFGTYRRKEKHLITEHGVTVKKLKCKACDKTFETQTALRIHTKRDHLIERRFQCSVCDKRCFTNVQLNQHTLKHTGIKKFQCTICLKAYGRKSTLREHMRIHENDRRFKCELCGMAFVQKCSWRGHMLSKHGQQV